MSDNKIMPWIDELEGAAATDFPARRDEIAAMMAEAAELADPRPWRKTCGGGAAAMLEDRAAGRTAATWLGSVRGLCPLASARTYCLPPGACAWLS